MARVDRSKPGVPGTTKSPGGVKAKPRVSTPDEKVDEASRESMDASDPPGYLSMRTGGPAREPDDLQIRDRAYRLWDAEGRPEGREEEFWLRAERELKFAQEIKRDV